MSSVNKSVTNLDTRKINSFLSDKNTAKRKGGLTPNNNIRFALKDMAFNPS